MFLKNRKKAGKFHTESIILSYIFTFFIRSIWRDVYRSLGFFFILHISKIFKFLNKPLLLLKIILFVFWLG